MTLSLSSAQKLFLRAQAHNLNPVVTIGDAGLTEAVMKEIERSIASHELIKIKSHSRDKATRDSQITEICETLNAASVQHIGKILIVYKPGEKAKLVLPKA